MSQRKISECISVRINVGNYQHIELTKYAEESIEYDSKEDLIKQEDNLRDDLVASLVRSMNAIPEKLGKGVENAQEVENAIKKAIPEWLENSTVPNIANGAAKKQIQNEAAQKDNKDQSKENLSEVTDSAPAEVKKEAVVESDEDLFEEDEMPEPVKVKQEKDSDESDDDIDSMFDDDDDLFD